jgi:hypothetical protein
MISSLPGEWVVGVDVDSQFEHVGEFDKNNCVEIGHATAVFAVRDSKASLSTVLVASHRRTERLTRRVPITAHTPTACGHAFTAMYESDWCAALLTAIKAPFRIVKT